MQRYRATNSTNESLGAIILAQAETAAYVPRTGEESTFASAFAGATLGSHTADLLEELLTLHARYASGDVDDSSPVAGMDRGDDRPLSSLEYARAVGRGAHRALLPHQRSLIGALSSAELATLILALQSGKVLAFACDGGRWYRASNYPHLSARAILHSVVAFSRDYSYESRQRINHRLPIERKAEA